MNRILNKLNSQSVRERVVYAAIVYLALFIIVTVISYIVLPEGILKNKNVSQFWEPSDSILLLPLQIFFYNLISTFAIFFASLFSTKQQNETRYISVGYLVLMVLFCVNAGVLGTWSFSVMSETPPLINRIMGIFDILHRSALWEMMGQLLITCAAAHISIVRTSGKNTTTRKFREIRLSKSEKIVLAGGFLLMGMGAIIESIAIITK